METTTMMEFINNMKQTGKALITNVNNNDESKTKIQYIQTKETWVLVLHRKDNSILSTNIDENRAVELLTPIYESYIELKNLIE